jgi:predicted dehydrogenase
MKPVEIALIGSGYWGQKLRRYFQKDPHFTVRHICNSKTNLKKVWPEVEAIMVATPINTHYQIVKKALLAGKHVFSEKPLTLRTGKAQELKKLAQKKKLSLCVDYTQTFSPSLKKASQKIDIGPLQAIEMTIKQLGRFLAQDVYWLLGSHCLSILDLFVPLEKLKFRRLDLVTNRNRTETGQIFFKKPNLKGQIFLSLNFPGKQSQVTVYGKKGTLVYDAVNQPSLKATWYQKKPAALAPNLISREKAWSIDEKNNLAHAVAYFYRVLKGKEKTNLEMAIKVTEILENLSTPQNRRQSR